jgi:hypothetical protein
VGRRRDGWKEGGRRREEGGENECKGSGEEVKMKGWRRKRGRKRDIWTMTDEG